MSVVYELPAGAFTISGDSRGPAVSLGRNRYNKSQLIFLDEGSLRVANKAFAELGFVNPEEHKETLDELAANTAELDQAHATIAELGSKVEALEQTVGFKTHAADAESQAKLVPDLEQQIASLTARAEKAEAAAAEAKKPTAKSKPKASAKRKTKTKGAK